MTLLIAILAVVFLVLTIMVISRTQTLMKGMKGETNETPQSQADSYNDMNGIGLFIFWILSVIGVIWSFNEYKGDFLMSAREFWPLLGDVPTASSEHGRETDYWFWVSMVVITISFLVVNSVLFYFPFKYRFKEGRKAHFYPHNNTLEIIWTAIPAVVMAGLVFSGLMLWNKVMDEAPEDAEKIDIMGKQFAWFVRYSGVDNKFGKHNYKNTDDGIGNEMGVDFSDENSFDDFTSSSEMHIPKGRAVLLKIRARDVLHSVFIPHMRVKMDAVPGMPTKFWFKPEKSTADMRTELGNPNFNYELACTEVCGRSHFGMRLIVVVDEPAEYEKWRKEQKPILTVNPAAMDQVPENLKAKALKFAEPDAAPSTESVTVGVATSTSVK